MATRRKCHPINGVPVNADTTVTPCMRECHTCTCIQLMSLHDCIQLMTVYN